jgi:probable addiction module antidote protein
MVDPTPYDPSEFLATGAEQAELLDDALRSGNGAYVAHALGIVAKARGMSEIARKTGVKRQSLYSALDEGGNPRSPRSWPLSRLWGSACARKRKQSEARARRLKLVAESKKQQPKSDRADLWSNQRLLSPTALICTRVAMRNSRITHATLGF